jgi:hypothetical protein
VKEQRVKVVEKVVVKEEEGEQRAKGHRRFGKRAKGW